MLKFLSRSFAGILFTFSFFFFIASISLPELVENLPKLETSLNSGFSDSDFFIEQIAQQSGLTKEEILNICSLDPSQEACQQINNPPPLASPGIRELEKQISPYLSIIKNLFLPTILLLILSVIFYYFGTRSSLIAAYKVSKNLLFSSFFTYLSFKTLPTKLPNLVEKAFSITSEQNQTPFPDNFHQVLSSSVTEWMRPTFSKASAILFLIMILSLVTTISLYFIKKRTEASSKNAAKIKT